MTNNERQTTKSESGARRCALDILCRVENGAYADPLIESSRSSQELNPSDSNLLQELVLGTLTWQGTIDHLLSPYLKKPLSELSSSLRNILRLGVYQLRYLDRIPAYAVVSQSVDAARGRDGDGAAGFVNAVLRGVSEDRQPVQLPDSESDPSRFLSLETSHPEWMVARWIRRWGFEETRRLCEFNNARPSVTIRANPSLASPAALQSQLKTEGISVEPSSLVEGYFIVPKVGALFRTQAFSSGWFSVQGEGAGLVVACLDPRPGERILDLCSAPGGKATAAAEKMKQRGLVLAVDLHAGRLRRLRQNLGRLRQTAVVPVIADGRLLPTRPAFHRVLVDAPCSAIGVLSHHPERRWTLEESDLPGLIDRQLELIKAAADQVLPGGVLVYSTCSLEPEENEGVVEAFLDARADFRLDSAPDLLNPDVSGPYLQTLPQRHGCDGAFAARFERG